MRRTSWFISAAFPLTLALCTLAPLLAHASSWTYAFGTDVQVSEIPEGGGSGLWETGQHNIVVRGNRVFVCWVDRRDSYPAIYFTRSLDGGATFEPEVLVNESGSAQAPWMAADDSGEHVYVTWSGVRFGPTDFGLYFDRSLDGGATFGADRYLPAECPAPFYGGSFMATDGADRIFLLGCDRDSVYVMRSSDAGASFECPERIAVLPSLPFGPGPPDPADIVVAPDGRVYAVVSRAYGDLGVCWAALVLRSDDGGLTFGEAGEAWCGLTFRFAATASGALHVAQTDYRSPVYDYWVMYGRSSDGGVSWDRSQMMDPRQWAGEPAASIGANGAHVGLAWTRPEEGNRLVFAGSIDEGSRLSPVAVVNDSGGAGGPAVAIADNGDACVLWQQNGQIWFDRGVLSITTDVASPAGGATSPIPGAALLARPNPSSSAFEIEWSGAGGDAGAVLDVYDAAGRRIRTLGAPALEEGRRRVRWDGRDDEGKIVSAGVYFARPRGGEDTQGTRMVVVR